MNRTKVMWLLGALLTANLLVWVQSSVARRQGVTAQLDLLMDLRQQIVNGYVEKPDETKMVESAARAMVDSLEDPYTVYFSPEERAQFERQVRGAFSGIGAEIDVFERHIRIATPLEESPAWKAGVMAGDIILAIDGQSTLDMSITDAVAKLTGAEGTDVTITVRHLTGEEVTLTITRARINIQTVKGATRHADHTWNYMLDPQRRIGYIRLTQFNERTTQEMLAALQALVAQDVQGLILDLRFNPGGLLDAAVSVSDMFLPAGKRIVSTRGRTVPEQVHMSTDDSVMLTQPMVVLINEASASAAEIVSGALLDNGRAQVVGTRSFGKGSVQQVRVLGMELGSLNPNEPQSAIKITNAYYYLPNGRNIHRKPRADTWGVDPRDGFYVPMNPQQIRGMMTVRRERDVLRAVESNRQAVEVTPQWIEDRLADPQLSAGFRAVAGMLESGQWPVVGLSDVQAHELASRRQSLEEQRQAMQDRLSAINAEIARLDAPAGSTPPGSVPGSAPENHSDESGGGANAEPGQSAQPVEAGGQP